MKSLARFSGRLAELAAAMPVPSEAGKSSEEMIREVAALVADEDEREAALAALPAEEQAAARAEARLEFVRGLEDGTAEDRAEWARMHAEAVRVLADPAHARMIPVLRRFAEGIARMPPATDAESDLLAREKVRP